MFLSFFYRPTLYVGEYEHGIFALPAVVEEGSVPVVVRTCSCFNFLYDKMNILGGFFSVYLLRQEEFDVLYIILQKEKNG